MTPPSASATSYPIRLPYKTALGRRDCRRRAGARVRLVAFAEYLQRWRKLLGTIHDSPESVLRSYLTLLCHWLPFARLLSNGPRHADFIL